MRDPNFERAVVLLCQYSLEGALGLVINRDGGPSLEVVLEGLSLEAGPDARGQTWWGGPVDRNTGFVIWRGRVSDDEGWSLGEIAVSPSMERLHQLVASGTPFHLCLGYAGWAPRQLDEEIAQGSWLYADIDPSLVFDTPLPDRYDSALALLGLKADSVWMLPVNE